MKRTINLGLIGFGTVGEGVVKLLKKNASVIERKSGTRVRIARICDKNPRRAGALNKYGLSRDVFTTKINEVINDDNIDIVIELIGGCEPARKYMLEAIRKGRHIVTANKALLAEHWSEIFSEADKHKVLVYIEASVCSGIPIIQSLNEGLSANKIKSILGILNGTTNYILTKMSKERMDFASALMEAKKYGFAETDASLDVNGMDAVNKLVILGSVTFGAHIKLSDVYCEGIENIMQEDIEYAYNEFGYVLKLLAILKNNGKAIDVRVHPALVPGGHLLSSVDNEYNAVYIEGDAVGEMMFFGKGAGEMPAASAVVSDIIYLSKNINNDIAGRAPYIICNSEKKLKVMNIKDIRAKYYIRISSVDRPGVLSRVSGVLGEHNVSIASVYQVAQGKPRGDVPIIMVTHIAREGDIKKALSKIDRLSMVGKKSILIRIEEPNE